MALSVLFSCIVLVLAKRPFEKHKAVTLQNVHAKHQLIVKFDNGNIKSATARARACGDLSLKPGVRSVDVLNGVQMCVVETDTLLTQASLKADLVGDAKVEDVAEDQYVSINILPNDDSWSQLQHLQDIDAPLAWDIFTGEGAVTEVYVAVIDSGVAYDHPDLNARMWRNPNEVPNDGVDNDGNGIVDDVFGVDFSDMWHDNNTYVGDPNDSNGHGTHCAGIVAAHGNNGRGVIGVAWNGVKLMALKFIDASGYGTVSAAVKSLNYAFEHGASISSNSWSGKGSSSSMNAAIKAVKEGGHLVIAASGNEAVNNDNNPTYPCNYDADNLMCVGSIESDGSLSGFSNFGGTTVDICAPGSSVYSTDWNNGNFGYIHQSGTSMATPVVAGLAALLKAFRPSLTAPDLKNILMSTVDRSTTLEGKIVAGGSVNAHSAMKLTVEKTEPSEPLPVNWPGSTTLAFVDMNDHIGTIEGDVSVAFPADIAERIHHVAFFFAQSDGTTLVEIMSVNLETGTVQSGYEPNSVYPGVATSARQGHSPPPRRLRSLYRVSGGRFRKREELMMRGPTIVRNAGTRRVLAETGRTHFEYRMTATVPATATHLAMKIGNGIGFSVEVLTIPLEDKGFPVGNPMDVHMEDADPRPGFISGTLKFNGARSERDITDYLVFSSDGATIATVPAHGMQEPRCDSVSTHCDSITTHWRETDNAFVMHRGPYEAFEFASFTFVGPGTFQFEFLHVETNYDFIQIGDRKYTGYAEHTCRYDVPPGPITVIWFADYSTEDDGFTLVFTPHNNYSAFVPHMPSSQSPITVSSAYNGKMRSGGGLKYNVVDKDVQLNLEFIDRDYTEGKIDGPLVVTVRYRGQVDGINAYFAHQDGTFQLHSSHHLTSADVGDTIFEIPVPDAAPYKIGAKVARVALTKNGQELTGTASRKDITLHDEVGHAPRAVRFSNDSDARRNYIQGNLTVNRAHSKGENILEYRAYSSRGTDKLRYIGSAAPIPLTATCAGEACVHSTITEHDNYLILDFLDSTRANYESYERVVIQITGPGELQPTFLDVEEGYDFLSVFQGPESNDNKVITWSISIGELDDTTEAITLGSGLHEIVWTTDYGNPQDYQGWRLKWMPTTESTINVNLEDAHDVNGILVVSAYGNANWTSEMDTGIYVEVSDWFMESVQCTETHMACPLPSQWSTYSYHIRGAETDTSCQKETMPLDGEPWVGFRFEKTECNVQRLWDFTRGVVIDQVVLIPDDTAEQGDTGTVVFFHDTVIAPQILCQCESPIDGQGSFITIPEQKNNSKVQETLMLKNSNEFKPTMRLYEDASFSRTFGSGEAYPHTGENFYWEISSAFALDYLAIQSCRASPSNDFTSQYAVDIITDFCGQPHFNVHFIDSAPSSRARRQFSVRKFAFAGQTELFLRCSVRRCDTSDTRCGVCSPRRQLGAFDAAAQTHAATVSLWVHVRADDNYLLLDNAPATDVFVIETDDVKERLRDALRVVQTQVRFASAPPWLRHCSGAEECGNVARALECSLARTIRVDCENVVVTSIRERGVDRRVLLQGGEEGVRPRSRRLENGGVEVMFSIREPENEDQAAIVSAGISNMAAGGENIQVFSEALKTEITDRMPEADISSISSSSVAVAEPIIAEPAPQDPTPPTSPSNPPNPFDSSNPTGSTDPTNPVDSFVLPPGTSPPTRARDELFPAPTSEPNSSVTLVEVIVREKGDNSVVIIASSACGAVLLLGLCTCAITQRMRRSTKKSAGLVRKNSWRGELEDNGRHKRLEDEDDESSLVGLEKGKHDPAASACQPSWIEMLASPKPGVPRLKTTLTASDVLEDVSDADDGAFTLDSIFAQCPLSPSRSVKDSTTTSFAHPGFESPYWNANTSNPPRLPPVSPSAKPHAPSPCQKSTSPQHHTAVCPVSPSCTPSAPWNAQCPAHYSLTVPDTKPSAPCVPSSFLGEMKMIEGWDWDDDDVIKT